MKRWIWLLLIFTAIGCSTPGKSKLPGETDQLTIRYINIQAIFEFLSGRDREVVKLKAEKEETMKALQDAEDRLLKNEGQARNKAYTDYRDLKKKLVRLEKDEASVKTRLLKQINTSVKLYAKEVNADFIFNMGDEVIFARKKFDITEEVIKEIIKLEKRSEPIVR